MLLNVLFFFSLASLVACEPSVVIVGAGASGIAAATKLLKNGVTNITILEAEDRIGGRIYSVPFGKGYVDLGAEWCHGEKGNIVHDMVKDLGVLRSGSNILPLIYHSKLKALERNFSDALTSVFDNQLDWPTNQSANLGEYLIEMYKNYIEQWKSEPDKYATALSAIDLFEAYINSYEGSFSWFDVNVKGDFVDSDGDPHLNWNGHGYKTILELLMQKYPDASKSLPIDDKILLKKEVDQITWNSDQVVVRCSDGSSYSADHVIVTVSLGVLKHQHGTLFQPKLPADKVKAIEQLGIAGVHKMLFHFPSRWWNDTDAGYCFLWDNLEPSLSVQGPVKNRKSWITSMAFIVTIPHNPNVLEAWIVGDFVPEVEQTADEVVIDGLMYVLKHFNVVDSKNLVRPDGIIRNNWYTNPHFRGTYSFQTPSTRLGQLSDEVLLSMPLGDSGKKPKVLFAGEASNPTHFSTVHGAIETGFREADRIIKMYI